MLIKLNLILYIFLNCFKLVKIRKENFLKVKSMFFFSPVDFYRMICAKLKFQFSHKTSAADKFLKTTWPQMRHFALEAMGQESAWWVFQWTL